MVNLLTKWQPEVNWIFSANTLVILSNCNIQPEFVLDEMSNSNMLVYTFLLTIEIHQPIMKRISCVQRNCMI